MSGYDDGYEDGHEDGYDAGYEQAVKDGMVGGINVQTGSTSFPAYVIAATATASPALSGKF